jgi:hypothetical protein
MLEPAPLTLPIAAVSPEDINESSAAWAVAAPLPTACTANDNGDYGMYAAYPVVSGDNIALRNAQHDCNLVRCNG